MLRIECPAQNYAWGRPAASSEVAQLAAANGVSIDDTKPYAELWVGTHPSGPAILQGTSTTLKSYIASNPSVLGSKVQSRWGTELPFLFKVLSVETALSIQSHPDKKLAEQLHASDPKNYKDDNHKPEMALALNNFRALCAFVETQELKAALEATPELREVVGEGATQQLLGAEEGDKEALRAAFTALMTADSTLVAQQLSALVSRLESMDAGSLGVKEALVLELNAQYPNDVGVLAAYFLNLVSLEDGQAIYLAANNPHAYVSGELVECMATSDNVIRAGLTPKFRDTAVLCDSLTYEQGLPEVLDGIPQSEFVRCFRPPFEEFEIWSVRLPAGESTAFPTNQGPMLLLVQSGSGSISAEASVTAEGLVSSSEMQRGAVLFVAAGSALTFTASDTPLVLWLAACNGNFFTLHGITEGAPAAADAEAAGAEVEELVAA